MRLSSRVARRYCGGPPGSEPLFFTSLVAPSLWSAVVQDNPTMPAPAHPRMMLLEAPSPSETRISSAAPPPRLVSAKVRHVCPPQIEVPHYKRSARSISVSFRSCWRCRPVSSRLVRILQIRAFPFRHCTEFGSPSQNRTEVGRFRAGRFATKLRGGSCFAFGWQLVSLRCSAHRPRASKARTLLHELQAVLRSAALPWERSVIAIARSHGWRRTIEANHVEHATVVGIGDREPRRRHAGDDQLRRDGAHGRI
jgi:hypothetical protein